MNQEQKALTEIAEIAEAAYERSWEITHKQIAEIARKALAALVLACCLAGIAAAQVICPTPPAGIPSTTAAILFQIGPNSAFNTCEPVTLDASASVIRTPAGGLSVIAFTTGPVAPPHPYTSVTQFAFKQSNVKNTSPGTAFDGQVVWCSASSIPGSQTFDATMGAFLPAIIVEQRQMSDGTNSGQISVSSAAWPDGRVGDRHQWNQAHPACGGNPGLTFAPGAGQLFWNGTSNTSSLLLTITVIGLM